MQEDTSRRTVLIISMGFLGLYLLFSWNWAAWVSLIAGVAGIVSSRLSRKIEWLWMKLAKISSFIIPNILLTLVFFLILFPLARFARLVGKKDLLMLSPKHSTYFIDIDKPMDRSDFEKTW